MKLLAACAFAYAVGGFLTFGHAYNNPNYCEDQPKYRECLDRNRARETIAPPLWPVYWSARLAIEVTK